jgi:putative endopeptidase
MQLGSNGWLIGHELKHGFDDWGRTFDATAALRDWWTPEDAEAFKAPRPTWARSMRDSVT